MTEHTNNDSKNRKWKDGLLSSSVPLEFESARLLRESGFWINPEYAFDRIDENGLEKEFSVDLVATGFPPFDNSKEIQGELTMPLECKFRTRNKRWVFLPETPDEATSVPEAIRVIDQFSAYDVENKAISAFNSSLTVAYKGVEINAEKGDVHDAELKHGVYQLKYATPHIIAESILRSVSGHPQDNQPVFLCPLLVTTAAIYTLLDEVSIADVEASQSLDELMSPCPYVVLRTSNGPTFRSHLKRASQAIENIESADRSEIIQRRSKREKYPWNSPHSILQNLAEGYDSKDWFNSFAICTLQSLPSFLDLVKSAVVNDARRTKFSFRPLPGSVRKRASKN